MKKEEKMRKKILNFETLNNKIYTYLLLGLFSINFYFAEMLWEQGNV